MSVIFFVFVYCYHVSVYCTYVLDALILSVLHVLNLLPMPLPVPFF